MRTRSRLGVLAAAGVVALGAVSAGQALAGSVVYANGALGVGGGWRSPAPLGTYVSATFNRMSSITPAGHHVMVTWCNTATCGPWKEGFGFIQQAQAESTYGWTTLVQLYCRNNYNPVITNGYCARYF